MAEQISQDVVKEAHSGAPAASEGNAIPNNDLPATASEPTTNTAPPSSEQLSKSTHATQTSAASAATTSTDAQPDEPPAEPKEQLVNGDAGEHSATESQIAVGDASGGSDTDISRPGSVDQATRPGGHLRTNSAQKKPASFKSVSVTKNFLAKSAVSAPVARPGEKPPTAGQAPIATQQTAKPRLVAKSGASNVPRSISKLNGAGSGPDASKVWNKNQPVPPPPPKQFTDEELKQQYGIHLATRLQADEGGKEAKWADIDDDEDDWAPETVQWMDGTKSTVAAVENQPPPVEEPKFVARNDTPTLAIRPTPAPTSSAQKPSSAGGTKTILKPGAHILSSASKPKGQSDKPSLVAKPSFAAPVKSPWAPLPPVDRVSPVHVHSPAQPPPRFSQRDSHGYDAMGPPPNLAKEIAPDDFNRSWRDDRANRELFNPHSGLHEPVSEMRRGSMRESNFRQQPSVLQRSSHDGPAEPSAAFQTSRTSADAPSWGRRRNSSNVSGGSGRRMSFDRRAMDLPPMPMNIQRRESQSINGIDAGAPGTPRHALSAKATPTEQHASLAQKPSPSISHAQPASPFGSVGSSAMQDVVTPGQPTPDLVVVQERLLHGNLDQVKLRKLKEKEQEAKEEAERKERIRKKLEAMGLTDDFKAKSKEASPSRAAEKSPQKEKAVPAPIRSPPKPPVPEAEEVASYGMMKVYQPQPVKKQHATEKPMAPKPSPSPVKAQAEVPKPPLSLSQPPPSGNNLTGGDDQDTPRAELSQQTEGAGPQGPKPTPLSQAPWSSSSQQPQPRPWGSVWGPPQTRDRALGNGTFDTTYNQSQPRPGPPQLPPQAQPSPTPVGLNPPPNSSSSQPPAPLNQSFAQRTMHAQTGTSPANTGAAPTPGPIAPPVQKGWGNFQARIRLDDQEVKAKAQHEYKRLGGESLLPEIREKYTDQKGQSQTTLHIKVGGLDPKAIQDAKPKEEVNKVSHEGPTPPHVIPQGPHLHSATQAARSSRFFPRQVDAAPQASQASSESDTAPPPETENHPAFSGDSGHVVVRLPPPAPVVKLPPTATESAPRPEAPVSMPTRAPFGARPLALTQEWQARFNSLLEKTPSSPAASPPVTKPHPPAQTAGYTKPGSLAVAASSKAPLDVPKSVASATVSLPNAINKEAFIDDGSSDTTTRTSADHLLEDREFGSLPTVRLSKVSHLAANEPPAGFPPAPRQNSRFGRPVDFATNKSTFEFPENRHSDTVDVLIRLGNISQTITKSVPRKRKGGRALGQKPKRNFTPNGTPANGQNQRPRKPSGYQGQVSSSSSSPRTSSGNGWSNSRSTPPQNHPWGRRAAPVH